MIQIVQNLDSKTTSAFLSDTDILLSDLARTDANIFIESVLKDGKGKKVLQAQIHKEIHWHIDECERTGNQYCGILAPWGFGKCFAKGELINDCLGSEFKIENYSGQRIFDGDGKPTKPLWHGNVGLKETYIVNFTSGRTQVATYDHPFMTQRGWVKASELQRGDKIRLISPKHTNRCKKIKNPWLAGLYLGDGSYAKLSCGDTVILNELSKLGNVTYLGQYDYYLRGISSLLKDVWPRGLSKIKKSVPNLRVWDTESVAEFLAGWFDADGTVSFVPKYRIRKDGSRYQKARRYSVELYSINKDWLKEAQYALLRLNIPSILTIKNGRYKGQRHISWRLLISGKANIRAFRDRVPMRSSKALKLFDKAIDEASPNDEIYDGVSSILFNGVKECWGFTMPSGVHSINGVVSHNTENCIIGRVLHNIGKDPNLRNAIVTNTDDNSKARVSSITKYILYDEDYKRLFPHVKPAQNSDWSKHKLIVDRDSRSKDGTLEAWGITTSGTGSRFDRLFFDDIVDQRNAIANPALREAVKDAFNNVWLSRLSPDGIAIYIATVWHQDDNTATIRANDQWKFLVMSVSEDLSCIECESAFKGKYKIPLWDYWNAESLKKRRSLIGKRAFDRGYRQIALSDEDRTFPSSETIFRKDVDLGVVRNDWPRCVGIDPFGQAVVIFVLALDPVRRRRFPIEIRRGKWQPTQTVAQIIDVHKKHNPQIVVCENNASQEAIIQWLAQTDGGYDIPVVPFTTGKQKVDPAFGLPSLEIEFANGLWIVPCAHVDENDAEDPINVWRKELLEHPLSAKEDTVMASWFAREGARYLLREDTDEGEIYTGEDFGVEQVIIGDY